MTSSMDSIKQASWLTEIVFFCTRRKCLKKRMMTLCACTEVVASGKIEEIEWASATERCVTSRRCDSPFFFFFIASALQQTPRIFFFFCALSTPFRLSQLHLSSCLTPRLFFSSYSSPFFSHPNTSLQLTRPIELAHLSFLSFRSSPFIRRFSNLFSFLQCVTRTLLVAPSLSFSPPRSPLLALSVVQALGYAF